MRVECPELVEGLFHALRLHPAMSRSKTIPIPMEELMAKKRVAGKTAKKKVAKKKVSTKKAAAKPAKKGPIKRIVEEIEHVVEGIRDRVKKRKSASEGQTGKEVVVLRRPLLRLRNAANSAASASLLSRQLLSMLAARQPFCRGRTSRETSRRCTAPKTTGKGYTIRRLTTPSKRIAFAQPSARC